MAHAILSRVRRLSILPFLAACFTPAPLQAQALPAPEQRKPPVYVGHPDESESFDMVVGINRGGGFDSSSPRRPVAYTGVKLGGGCCARGKHPLERALTVTFDLGYDRLRSRNGVSGKLSVMIPVIRFPNPGTNEAKKFIRIYAEPGAGVRVGGGGSAVQALRLGVKRSRHPSTVWLLMSFGAPRSSEPSRAPARKGTSLFDIVKSDCGGRHS